MVAGGEALRRTQRIRRRWEFQRFSREGTRVRSESFVALLCSTEESDQEDRRLGVTVSRRVGKAVVRTRVKRRIREWFRRHRDLWPDAMDVVIIARPRAAKLPGSSFGGELGALAERARERVGS